MSNDPAGRSVALAPPCLLLCFGNSVNRKWTENKNDTIYYRFISFILTVKRSAALAACVLRATTKKLVNFCEEKSAPPDSGWPDEYFLTSKLPGSFTALAPPLLSSRQAQVILLGVASYESISQQTGLMLSFGKLIDLDSAVLHVYVMYRNISEWLTVDYLIAYKVLPTASHIYYQKHHLGIRPRGHSYALPICRNLYKRSFISRCLFCFLWSLNSVSY